MICKDEITSSFLINQEVTETKLLNSGVFIISMQPKRKLFDDPELDRLVKEARSRHIFDKVKL